MKVGERLRSPGSGVEVIVVRAPGRDVEVICDGEALVVADGAPASGGGDAPDGTLLGKRYSDEGSGLELLCTHGGPGALEVDGVAMAIREAKALPSSD